MKYCGIDCGSTGALGFSDGTYEKMPTWKHGVDGDKTVSTYGVEKILTDKTPDLVAIEHQQPMGNKTSRKSCFKMGRNYQSVLEGVMNYAEKSDKQITVLVVKPQQWKRTLGLMGGTGMDKKAKTMIFVKNIFGHVLKKSQDGIADALAIAEYARRKY